MESGPVPEAWPIAGTRYTPLLSHLAWGSQGGLDSTRQTHSRVSTFTVSVQQVVVLFFPFKRVAKGGEERRGMVVSLSLHKCINNPLKFLTEGPSGEGPPLLSALFCNQGLTAACLSPHAHKPHVDE